MMTDTLSVSYSRLEGVVRSFRSSSLIVIGDCMLDEYFWGDVERISPEAPVPIVAVESVTRRMGGAANVVQNLTRLGVSTHLISVCGNDDTGTILFKMLDDIGCDTTGLFRSASRPTPIKTRIIARHQQVVRADRERIADLNSEESTALATSFMRMVAKTGGVILSDYGKGVICPDFVSTVLDGCRRNGTFIAVDPKDRHMNLYKGVSIITPNLKEAHFLAGVPLRHCSNEEIQNLGWRILDDYALQYLLITLSERGMALFTRSTKQFVHLPTVAQKVFDVTGAGDTVISVFCAAITAGAQPVEAAFLANHAAGLTVAQIGTAAVSPEEILASCK